MLTLSTGKIGRIGLHTNVSSTVLTKFHPVRLFQIWNWKDSLTRQNFEMNENVIAGESIFCRSQEEVFFRQVEQVGTSLGQAYPSERRLYWNINCYFFKKFVFLCRLGTFRTTLICAGFHKFTFYLLPAKHVPAKALFLMEIMDSPVSVFTGNGHYCREELDGTANIACAITPVRYLTMCKCWIPLPRLWGWPVRRSRLW